MCGSLMKSKMVLTQKTRSPIAAHHLMITAVNSYIFKKYSPEHSMHEHPASTLTVSEF